MNKKREKYLWVSGAVISGVVLVIVILKPFLHQNLTGISEINYAEKISNVQAETNLQVEYISAEATYSTTSTEDNDNITVLPNDSLQAVTAKNKYSVSYRLQMPENRYIDAAFTINRDNKKLQAELSGVASHSTVAVAVNEKPLTQNIPVDWAGKIKIDLNNIDYNDQTLICLSMVTPDNEKAQPFSLCHHVMDLKESEAL